MDRIYPPYHPAPNWYPEPYYGMPYPYEYDVPDTYYSMHMNKMMKFSRAAYAADEQTSRILSGLT